MQHGVGITLLGCAALSLSSTLAFAAEQRFSIDHEAPSDCPSKQGLVENILARTSAARPTRPGETPDVSLWARLSRAEDGSYRGRLTITVGGKESQRELQGETCEEVASALALVSALALDPLARTGGLPPLPLPPEPFVYKEVGTRPAFILPGIPVPMPQPDGLWLPVPPEALLAPPPLPADPSLRSQVAQSRSVFFRAALALEVGQAPTPLVGLQGELGVTESTGIPWSFGAGLSYLSQTSSSQVQPAESALVMRTLRGHMTGCAFRYRPLEWLGIWPCVEVSGGGLWALVERDVFGTLQTSEEVSPWLSMGPEARLVVEPTPWLSGLLSIGPDFPLVRGRFANDRGQELFVPSPAVLSASLGLGLSF